MAARVQQVLSKAKSAAEPLFTSLRTQAGKQYDTLMTSNAQYVVKDKDAADKLLKQWFFTRMSRWVQPAATAAQQGQVAMVLPFWFAAATWGMT